MSLPVHVSDSFGETRGEGSSALLDIRGLSVSIPTERGMLWPLDEVSVTLRRGETLGLVGESGSGKSMLSRAVMGITPDAARVDGVIEFDGIDVVADRGAAAARVWGRRAAMVFQDSMTSLNPVVRIGRQVGEAARHHFGLTRAATRARVLELLEQVGIPEPRRRMSQYPHQLSGGMRQRVAIAMALACDPELLIADEATTALDVTVQQQILELLQDLQRERGMTMIIVSHDLGVVAGRTDRIAVMYGGRVVETAATPTLFSAHRHQYTRALLGSLPSPDQPRHTRLRTVQGSAADPVGRPDSCRFAPRCPAAVERCHAERPALVPAGAENHRYACFVPVEHLGAPAPVAGEERQPAGEVLRVGNDLGDDAPLRVRDLVTTYAVRGGTVHAVSGINFDLHASETLGMVGESGCGKSTAARSVVGLTPATSGRVILEDTDLTSLPARRMRELRSRIQIVLQDPLASLNPRRTVRGAVAEGLNMRGVNRAEAARRVDDALREVGVDPQVHGDKRAHQLSGGQAQRVVIARAIVLEPQVLICDEPVSALDVSVRAQVLNLLERIKTDRGLSMLFVSHDLGVVRNISDRVAVMYLGVIVEIGDADLLYHAPAHPYTQALIAAVPEPDPEAEQPPPSLEGQLPSPMAPPSGCRFRTRCPIARDICAEQAPPMVEVAPGQHAACHFPTFPDGGPAALGGPDSAPGRAGA